MCVLPQSVPLFSLLVCIISLLTFYSLIAVTIVSLSDVPTQGPFTTSATTQTPTTSSQPDQPFTTTGAPSQTPTASSEPNQTITTSDTSTQTPTTATVPSIDPPGSDTTQDVEVVTVVMNNMENYLPTDVVEEDDEK